ncbi:hypothetical protein [Nonomuraea rhizosphaerae]|uniref:hypothetical protein n=1 Tax=Nonomuraea rhizosphaerae TaxID=2665663 RepID=UPI001C5F0040|nr:hypothetical protein [Nonomuraea rhizosphaerae]
MTSNHRPALITGLRDLADFLETNPDIPVRHPWVALYHFPDGATDQDRRDQIDKIAAYLGSEIDPTDLPDHYQTRISFGPVTYKAIAISTDARARHNALSTYTGCVEPDSADAA